MYLYDPRVINTFSTHLKESDVVINTVGILNEDKNNTFQDIHYNFVRSLLNKSKEHGVSKFIHLSALMPTKMVLVYIFKPKVLQMILLKVNLLKYLQR